MLRRTALLVAAAMVATVAPHAWARSPAPVRAPVIAVIDSGVRATHQEFDYRGPTSAADQLVAWWDFSTDRKATSTVPRPGQLWDPRVPQPYDDNGHGTLTAAMAAGRNASAAKTPSAAPGARLAIAKVTDAAGSAGDPAIAAAIRWATTTVHADVITMSLSNYLPVPADLDRQVYDALSAARRAGVLVVVSNGNGWLDSGVVPGDPGWASASSASPDVLAVGARYSTGLLNSTDPEVASVYAITGPSSSDDTSYTSAGGTSFGTPYVAGFAAAVLLASRQGGHPLGADALELFVKQSSHDTAYPPQAEGYGELTQHQLPTAVANARAGRLPTRPRVDVSAIYVDRVVGNLRRLWVTL